MVYHPSPKFFFQSTVIINIVLVLSFSLDESLQVFKDLFAQTISYVLVIYVK